jgi:hypothetical protein
MLVFNKYFYKNKKSKLYFGDRVAVLNDFIYQTGGSMYWWIPHLVGVASFLGQNSNSRVASFSGWRE